MADAPNIIEQQPAGGPVNRPDSGTYGEKAALERLQASLPGMDPAAPAAPAAPPGQPGPGPLPPQAPAGLPSVLTEPTRNPGVPVSTPLQPQPTVGADRRAQALQQLQILMSSPEVSEETREWAAAVLNKIVRSANA